MNKKIITIGVIFLLFSITVIPSFYAEIPEIDDTVKFEVNFCGIDKTDRYNISLTREQAYRLDGLFDELKNKLDNTTSREESIAVYDWAVVELDKLGLFGDTSIEKVKKLVSGDTYYNELLKNQDLYKKLIDDDPGLNVLSLVTGKSDGTVLTAGPICTSLSFLFYLYELLLNVYPILIFLLPLDYIIVALLFEVSMFYYLLALIFHLFFVPLCSVSFGGSGYGGSSGSAEGWARSSGLFGVKSLNGSFYGQIFPYNTILTTEFIGILGFTGIFIMDKNTYESYYFGTALLTNINYNRPMWEY